jgi:hypothetical protein
MVVVVVVVNEIWIGGGRMMAAVVVVNEIWIWIWT